MPLFPSFSAILYTLLNMLYSEYSLHILNIYPHFQHTYQHFRPPKAPFQACLPHFSTSAYPAFPIRISCIQYVPFLFRRLISAASFCKPRHCNVLWLLWVFSLDKSPCFPFANIRPEQLNYLYPPTAIFTCLRLAANTMP